MDLVTAEIQIGGDLRNVMIRGVTRPVTVPEIEVLRLVHGEDSVTVGKGCGHVKRTAKEEKKRLADRYGAKLVDQVYPGINGNGMDVGKEPAPKKPAASKATDKKEALV